MMPSEKRLPGKMHWTSLSNLQRNIGENWARRRRDYKQQKRVAKIYRHTANQRKDFLHKESLSTAKTYDIVCVEDLNMRAMSNEGFGNGRATLDNGYGMFLNMLEYKLTERGKHLVKVKHLVVKEDFKMKMVKKICAMIVGVLLVFSQTKLIAEAEEPIIYLVPNSTGGYNEEACENFIEYNDGVTLSGGYIYFVKESIDVPGLISVNGTATLILGAGVTLKATKGIQVGSGSALKIYSQSGETMGALNATGENNDAGIGGINGEGAGTIEIYSGNITAKGGTDAAGIGGGNGGAAGDISISGGKVNATGGSFGAGIGSGTGGSNGGEIKISGSADVTANGGKSAAGIGGGKNAGTASIEISGGEVKAAGGNYAAGIGSGYKMSDEVSPKKSGAITISGGTVIATGGSYGGAGIVGGVASDTGNITISGGTIYATGNGGGAGIGGGKEANILDGAFEVNINDGEITAKGNGAAGIGNGSNQTGTPNIILDPKYGYSIDELSNGDLQLSSSGRRVAPQNDADAEVSHDNGRSLSFSFRSFAGGSDLGGICTINKQGPLCEAVFRAATPTGFSETFSFNLNMDITGIAKPNYDKKSGLLVMNIPESVKKAGRVFALIGVDINGVPKIFHDADASDETFTTNLDMDGYAFSFICD